MTPEQILEIADKAGIDIFYALFNEGLKMSIDWNNKEDVKRYHAEYRRKNRTSFVERQRKYREKNRDMLNAKNKQYRINRILSNTITHV